MTPNPDQPALEGSQPTEQGLPGQVGAKAARPIFQVVMAGMSDRDQRLAKILMRHDPDTACRFELAVPTAALPPIILVANPFDAQGVRAIAAARSQAEVFAVIHVVPAQAHAQTRFTIERERLSLQLMPCLKQVVELAYEASPPGETLFNAGRQADAGQVNGTKAISLPPDRPAAVQPSESAGSSESPESPEASETAVPAEVPGAPAATLGSGGPHDGQAAGLATRCDALVVDLNDQRASATLAAFAQSPLSSRRCDPGELMNAIAYRQVDLVVLTPDETGFDLALTLKTQQAAREAGALADVVLMMVLDRANPLTYARARLAGCSVVITRPLDSGRLVTVLRKPLRRLRDKRRAQNPRSTSGASAGFSTPWLDTGTGH